MIWPTLHKTITVPDDARAFFVGDIHGGLDELNQALHEVGFNKEKDYLFAVGDLIDRGPKNLQVLALFLYDKTGRYHSVMGNHDAFLANVATPEYLWYMNGGKWAMDLTDDAREAIARDMCKRMPVFMNVKHRGRDFGLVHGGIPPQFEDRGVDIRQRDWYEVINGILDTPFPTAMDKWHAMEPFMWDRDNIAWAKANIKGTAVAEFPDVLGVDFTVHGHTPQREPLRYGNRIWLDTEGRKGTFSIMENDDCLTTVLMTPHGSGEEPKYIKLF